MARFRKDDAAFGAFHQKRFKMGFEGCDLAADGGWGNAQIFGRGADGACFKHGKEIAKRFIVDLHGGGA